ncbi:MAG: beta-ketoacyl-ACP synthase III [Gemmataceae bacterium]
MSKHAAITGWGWHSPERVLTNHELESFVETSDEWILTRTGIRNRHLAATGETTSGMAVQAARHALEKAQLSPHDIDLVICASTTPDYLLPATACLIQQEIGADKAGAFDLNAACSGFIYGLAVGAQFIQAGCYRRILVTAGETLSRFTNWQDRNTCVLFGDGAGAVVLEATDQDVGVISHVLGSRGDLDRSLAIEAGGCARPASHQTVDEGAHFIRMEGREVFRLAVRAMTHSANDALAKAGLTVADLRCVIPHQANLRIINATQEALGVPREKMYINVDRHGNTGATSCAIALGEMLRDQPANVGDNFLFVAFGGGYTWASLVLRWADIAAIMRERNLRLSA